MSEAATRLLEVMSTRSAWNAVSLFARLPQVLRITKHWRAWKNFGCRWQLYRHLAQKNGRNGSQGSYHSQLRKAVPVLPLRWAPAALRLRYCGPKDGFVVGKCPGVTECDGLPVTRCSAAPPSVASAAHWDNCTWTAGRPCTPLQQWRSHFAKDARKTRLDEVDIERSITEKS